MILYDVTIIISKKIENEWLDWMKKTHIKDVMNTGCFTDWQFLKLLMPEDSPEESTYLVRYSLQDFGLYLKYLKEDAPRLQKEHIEKFSGNFKALRAVYEVIG